MGKFSLGPSPPLPTSPPTLGSSLAIPRRQSTAGDLAEPQPHPVRARTSGSSMPLHPPPQPLTQKTQRSLHTTKLTQRGWARLIHSFSRHTRSTFYVRPHVRCQRPCLGGSGQGRCCKTCLLFIHPCRSPAQITPQQQREQLIPEAEFREPESQRREADSTTPTSLASHGALRVGIICRLGCHLSITTPSLSHSLLQGAAGHAHLL